MSKDRSTTTRRSFLGAATVGTGAAIGGVIAVPVAGYALASAGKEETFRPAALGPVERFTGEQGFTPTAAPYVEDPAQPLVSSGLAYVHHTGHANRDWLAPDAQFVVFSNRCTHVGCPAQSTAIGFSCPCHGSQFDQQGARVAGPAVRPLDRFQWEIRPDGNPALERPHRGSDGQVLPGEVARPAPERPGAAAERGPAVPGGDVPSRGCAEGELAPSNR